MPHHISFEHPQIAQHIFSWTSPHTFPILSPNECPCTCCTELKWIVSLHSSSWNLLANVSQICMGWECVCDIEWTDSQDHILTLLSEASPQNFNMSCMIGWYNDMWAVINKSSGYLIWLEQAGCNRNLLPPAAKYSGIFLSKPQHFSAASCWTNVVHSFNRNIAGDVCSGVLCSGSIPCCLQLYISTVPVCAGKVAVCVGKKAVAE